MLIFDFDDALESGQMHERLVYRNLLLAFSADSVAVVQGLASKNLVLVEMFGKYKR